MLDIIIVALDVASIAFSLVLLALLIKSKKNNKKKGDSPPTPFSGTANGKSPRPCHKKA